MRAGSAAKRLLVGRPLDSGRLGETLLPKRLALPIFCSDPLSSVAYATEEILLILALGGLAVLHLAWYAAIAIVILLVVVVASYRQTCHAYPGGGGAYVVSAENLGQTAALTAASALLIDYVMTVAVSIVSGVAALTSAAPALDGYAVGISVACVVVLAWLNLRGVRESGRYFAIPTYAFIATIYLMFAVAAVRMATGTTIRAESSDLPIQAVSSYTGLALVLLAMRAFASGCTALTGVEAVSNGVPAFEKPKSRNAATTLAIMGALAVTMFFGITTLAMVYEVHVAEDPTELGLAPGTAMPTALAQIGRATFGSWHFLFYLLQAVTAAVLIMAANTAFNGFPMLASVLGRDRYAPRQLFHRGDRLVYSNGIVLLSLAAIALIVAFDANLTRLIQLYILGVFVSFTLSQAGMVKHWRRELATPAGSGERGAILRRMAINAFGALPDGGRPRHRADHQVHARRLDRRHRHARALRRDEGRAPALRDRGRRGGRRARRPAPHARREPRHGPRVLAQRAEPAGPVVRADAAPRLADRGHRRGGPGGGGGDAGDLGRPRHRRASAGAELSVPLRRPADPAAHPGGARADRGLGGVGGHPRVRGGALVGAAPAQPECATAQGAAAVHEERRRHRRSVPARLRP
ncbi:APC family permease [Streptomyces sp. NPDC046237]|uniref:APC family permease n=1 Tax=Streptomyces sp. NPDC046237 TaxID=3154914 RepID=UPI003400B27D